MLCYVDLTFFFPEDKFVFLIDEIFEVGELDLGGLEERGGRK